MINISLCFGASWSNRIAVQVHSIVKNSSQPVTIYLVSDTFSTTLKKQLELIQKEYDCTCVLVDSSKFFTTHLIRNKNTSVRFSKYTLLRLTLPYLLDCDKVLYLDADTLVLSDLSEFYNQDLEGNLIAGSTDTGILPYHLKTIGSNPSFKYVNAGVLLMDLAGIREAKIHREWISLANKRKFGAHDQDIIHLTLRNRTKLFSPEYNCSLSTTLDIPDEDIKIMHYAGVKHNVTWVADLPKPHLWAKAEEDYNKFEEMAIEKYKPVPKIAKVIAYGWFGRGPKNEKVQYCIDSWKRVCPEYQVVELNEDNCDVNCNAFVKQAYESKKWAFVADFFRMKYMYDNGCITLDADVELLKPLDDFLHHGFFSGQEVPNEVLITATMGAEKGSPIIKMILDYYEFATFDPRNMQPNTKFISSIFKALISSNESGIIKLEGDGWLYPKEYFCNYNHRLLKNMPHPSSYAIHHFLGSWVKK